MNEALPTTSLQLRLSDGSRVVGRFNLTHTVGDIRRFIASVRPGGPVGYTLQMNGFPPKARNPLCRPRCVRLHQRGVCRGRAAPTALVCLQVLGDDSATIESESLANAVIVQK